MSRLLPWFRFDSGEWLLSTRGMSAEARGIFVQLLAEQWHNGNGLPVEDSAIFQLAGCTRKQWARCKDQILVKFQPKDGRLWNELLLNLQLEAQSKSAERSESGKLGNRKRWGELSHSDNFAIAQRSQTHREGDIEVDVEKEREKEKEGGTLSRSVPPVNDSKPSQLKHKSNGNGGRNGGHETPTAHIARALANRLQVPDDVHNLNAIESGLRNECLVSHCTELEAAEIIAGNTDPSVFGRKPARFFFSDGDWRNNPAYRPKENLKQ